MKKKMLFVMVLSLVISTFSTKVEAKGNEDYRKYLIKKGYPEEILNEYESEELEKIAESVGKGDGKATLSWNVLETDNLEEIQSVVNASDQDLKNCGLKEEEIKKARKEIQDISKKTDSQLKKELNASDIEIKYLRKAMGKNEKYSRKEIAEKASLSGSISSTKLSFSISKITKSTKKPDYDIKVTYKWSKPYYWEIFSDKIAVAWGGNLNIKNKSSNAEYYDIKGIVPFFKYKKYYNSKTWSYTEKPQKGIIFTIPQSTKHGLTTTRMKSGYVKFNLYQTKYKNYETNCVAQYAHKILGFGSVSISSSPGISVTGQYDTTNTKSIKLKY